MSADANIAIYDLLKGQSTPALTNLYNALTLEDPVTGEETMKVFHQQAPTDMERPPRVIVFVPIELTNALVSTLPLERRRAFDLFQTGRIAFFVDCRAILPRTDFFSLLNALVRSFSPRTDIVAPLAIRHLPVFYSQLM